jgi:hypothetical protein
MEVAMPYLLRCAAALLLLIAGPVFAQTADEAAMLTAANGTSVWTGRALQAWRDAMDPWKD